MSRRKRLRIFAGPNGSGKSSLKKIVESIVNIGVYVNADDILSGFRQSGRIEFSDYSLTVQEDDFNEAYKRWSIKTDSNLWRFENNGITATDKLIVEDYFVSFVADFIRNSLLNQVEVFSFETVMSHDSKLEFIRRAKESGYKVYLYFVSLPDPELNVRRVESRKAQGGHDVDRSKVISRYYRTMGYLCDAVKLADSVYFFDNQASEPNLFAHKENGRLITDSVYVPSWYKEYVLDKI